MTMASLKSIDNVPGIDYYEYRDIRYYGKYEYRLRVKIPGLRYTYWCKKPEQLDSKLSGTWNKYYSSIRPEDKPIVTEHLAALKIVIELQNIRKSKNLGLRVEGTTFTVFGNDLAELQSIGATFSTKYIPNYTQAQTTNFVGTKEFVNEPKHLYRVYLKSKRINDTFAPELYSLLKKTTELYPSTALGGWLREACAEKPHQRNWRYKQTSSIHFIDYDSESILSYLALMHGDILGKRYKLQKRPDPI